MSFIKPRRWMELTEPRVLQKGVTALVEVSLRPTTTGGRIPSLPLETAAENKEMGRVLIRRQGETIAAGEPPVSLLAVQANRTQVLFRNYCRRRRDFIALIRDDLETIYCDVYHCSSLCMQSTT